MATQAINREALPWVPLKALSNDALHARWRQLGAIKLRLRQGHDVRADGEGHIVWVGWENVEPDVAIIRSANVLLDEILDEFHRRAGLPWHEQEKYRKMSA